MVRIKKDCLNCKNRTEDLDCFTTIDKRMIRKLNRAADELLWDRFYCKNWRRNKDCRESNTQK